MLQMLKNQYHLLQAVVANLVFGFPSKNLKIIAITGTDGKTTTSTLLYHILKKAGLKVALISTVAAYIGEKEIDTGFHVTTPSPFSLQRLLAKIVAKNYEYVILEVTSHGIDQNRIWGIAPSIAGITNVTHEHLDYHKSFDEYLSTKAKLFLQSNFSFINEDAPESFQKLKKIVKDNGKEFQSFSYAKIRPLIKSSVEKRFAGQDYNKQNSALASVIALKLDIKDSVIAKAIEKFPGVKGRMEYIPNKKGLRIIVDFAHTPASLENALTAVQKMRGTKAKGKHGKVILIFGCAGLRDHTKRPLMGDIASKLADLVILTAEDPRTEDVWSIIAEIKSGVHEGHDKIISIANRYSAIEAAIKEYGRSGDTILITGKGHEKSMCYGTVEYPWSDQDAVKKILES